MTRSSESQLTQIESRKSDCKLQTVESVDHLRRAVAQLRSQDGVRTIGVVPTMGALHRGHLSLVEHSIQRCDATVVTIFVNPKQFAAGEDLGHYPRPIENDLRLIGDAGVDIVFVPTGEEVYPQACSTGVDPPIVSRLLEGEHRPAHFAGVATVVLKLLNMCGADVAFFGQKDYQQTLVVRHMVRDLNVPVEIAVCPIVRDDDGLALSSRNVYLNDDERGRALALSRTLSKAGDLIEEGESDGHLVMAQMKQSLIEGGVNEIDYAVVADAETLKLQDKIHLPTVLLVAARVGETRLIDNLVIGGRGILPRP